jgi:hypothetical protein
VDLQDRLPAEELTRRLSLPCKLLRGADGANACLMNGSATQPVSPGRRHVCARLNVNAPHEAPLEPATSFGHIVYRGR